jgi:hypothetical protein
MRKVFFFGAIWLGLMLGVGHAQGPPSIKRDGSMVTIRPTTLNFSGVFSALEGPSGQVNIGLADEAPKVSRAGDTMTGALVLSGDPTSALQAATKHYVDANLVTAGVAHFNGRGGNVVLTAGDVNGLGSASINWSVLSVNSGNVIGALGFTPENSANKGQANGYASLDSSGKLPAGQVASVAARNDQNNVLGAFYEDLTEISAPASPGSGTRRLYIDAGTHALSIKRSDGSVIDLEMAGVISFNGRVGPVSLSSGDVTSALGFSPMVSLAVSLPAEFSVAGSPATGAGTLTVTRAVQSANLVMAGPSSGAAAVPGYRALVAADIPALPESAITSLVSDLASKGTVSSVQIAVPADQSVSGGPITGSGTITITRNNQSANTVMAGPSSGGAAAPGYRVLVAADIPSHTHAAGDVTSGVFAPARTASVTALTDAATIATDASLGNYFRVTLGGNRTLGNPSNPTNGQKAIWEIVQDGTGSRTITLDTKFALGSDISGVTLSASASKRDFLTAVYNSTADLWYVVGFV